jgi:hypothetical protein
MNGWAKRFAIHDLRFTIHYSRFTIHDSRFTIHDLPNTPSLTVGLLTIYDSPPTHEWVG